jgi:competence protein ComEC
MLLPIVLWNYFEISTYGFLLNIVVIPLMSILLGAAVLGSLFVMLVPILGKFCLSICGVILELYEWSTKMSLKLPCARIVVGKPSIVQLVFYYIVLFLLLFCFYKKQKWKGWFIWLVVASLMLFVNFHSGLEITMLNVGQGDGVFLRGPTGTSYFIDGGSSDVDELGKYRIEPFLKSQGVGTLDYVFVSHGDTDHYNGIAEMLERQEMGVKIRYLVLPIYYQKDDALLQLASFAYKNGTDVLVIEGEERITEKELLIQCVQPTSKDGNVEGNASSMVLSISYKEMDFLFTGDVEGIGEERLSKRLPLDRYEVLKVSHHGSKNSSKEKFLEQVQPQIALISAGEKNSYGHPHKETLERLKRMDCKVYSTKENGAITLQTDGNSLTITTFP